MGERFDGFAIDRQAEIPIGVQLAWAVRTRIGDGTLRPGQRLPGLRDLAHELGVNLNTVRAVYQRLEHEGLIDTQQGSGTFIASVPRTRSGAGAIAASAAREAQQTGVDPREVAAALYVGAANADRARELRPDAADSTQTSQRRGLRRQIAALERALGELEAAYPGVAPAPARTRARGPALLSVTELSQARAELVQRLAAVQGAIDELTQRCDEPTSSTGRKRAADPRETTKPRRARRPRAAARPATAEA